MHGSGCLSKFLIAGAVLVFVVPTFVTGSLFWMRHRDRSQVDVLLSEIHESGLPASLDDANDYYDASVDSTDITDDWLEVLQMVASMPGLDFESNEFVQFPLPGTEWAQLQQVKNYLQEHQDVVNRLHKVAVLDGDVRFPDSLGWNANRLHHNRLRFAAQLLSFEARVAATERNESQFLNSVIAILRIGETLDDEPSTDAFIARVAICQRACEAIWDASGYLKFDSSDAHRLVLMLGKQRIQESLIRASIGDRAALVPVFMNPSLLSENEDESLEDYPFKYRDLAYYLTTMSDLVDASKEPLPDAIAASKAIGQQINEAAFSWHRSTRIVSGVLLPPVPFGLEAVAKTKAICLQAAISVAAENYRSKNGYWPESLSSLVPDFLAEVPTDPFDGAPMRYRPTDTSFRVYSVGVDLVDDGGTMEFNEGPRHKPDILIDWPRPIYEESELQL